MYTIRNHLRTSPPTSMMNSRLSKVVHFGSVLKLRCWQDRREWEILAAVGIERNLPCSRLVTLDMIRPHAAPAGVYGSTVVKVNTTEKALGPSVCHCKPSVRRKVLDGKCQLTPKARASSRCDRLGVDFGRELNNQEVTSYLVTNGSLLLQIPACACVF